MTSRRPFWPCWCTKTTLWELNSFLMKKLSFVPINYHRCQPRECMKTLYIFNSARSSRLGNPRQSWILDSTPWIPDFNYWIPVLFQLNLDCGFQLFVGFRIPTAVFWVPKSRILHGFHKQKFSRFRIQQAEIFLFPKSGFPYLGRFLYT